MGMEIYLAKLGKEDLLHFQSLTTDDSIPSQHIFSPKLKRYCLKYDFQCILYSSMTQVFQKGLKKW